MSEHKLLLERGDSPNGPFIIARCTCGAVSTFNGRNDKREIFAQRAPRAIGHWHEDHLKGRQA